METKPSIKTSEFWIHAALQLFFLLNTLQVWTYLPAKWSGLIQAILAAAYTVSRGTAKSGIPYGPSGAMGTDGTVGIDTTTDPTEVVAE
jgi:hypothetical protein